ncbi:MAG: 1-acyl-sn-glycerol-3-phosphate acyltransferase [Bacteroidales bacterium]|nr:1-acyl-sn-glycerol-3-phosphate acyltransferase [Bacteroidales bacterium]
MTNFLIRIFHFFDERTALLRCFLTSIIIICICAIFRISFVEDISSFLPQSAENERIQYASQHIGATNKLMVSVSSNTADEYEIMDAVESFVNEINEYDNGNRILDILYTIDEQQILNVGKFVINNMPYYLSDEDYNYIEQNLSIDSISAKMEGNKKLLLSPMGGFVKNFITLDPLHYSSRILDLLNQANPNSNYEIIDGYIFDKSGKEALIAISSKFPVSETSENAKLIADIDSAMAVTMQKHPEIKLDCIGASVISLGNAQRIKLDSFISTSIALIFILIVLLYFFRDIRALFIILFSLIFGGLFGMAFVSIFQDSVSIIAIGIGSIIVGIATNYPLHFLAHYQQGYSKEQTIQDIVDPLVTGNLTTVGAFLSLIFIHSNAMKDLGLFASFLLIGTILFVLLFLPHLFKKNLFAKQERLSSNLAFNKIASYNIDKNKIIVVSIIILTIPLYILSKKTTFETDLHAINYMTDSQREKITKLNEQTESNKPTFFCVAEGENVESALQNYEQLLPTLDSIKQKEEIHTTGINLFIPSQKLQQEKIAKWNKFIEKNKNTILENLSEACKKTGFKENSFADFESILNSEFHAQEPTYFEPIIKSIGNNFISNEDNRVLIYTIIETENDTKESIEQQLNHLQKNIFTFDNATIINQMVDALSEDFDYVLYICGLIVFIFLTFSFGRLELSITAFIPLTVGWIWILGLMGLFDMKFNIVNIILATFIFGQGDDYTIFVTEGLMYEYTYKKKMLASYKNSVWLSATIMFIGIGSLILAKHPAMRSLGEVTIIGMFSVVLMAYLFPPLVFRFLTQKNGKKRLIPITLKNLCATVFAFIIFLIGTIYLTLAGFFAITILGKTDNHKKWYHKRLCNIFRFLVKVTPNVDYEIQNIAKETFEKPGIIISNHQSHLDLMYLLMLNPKIICLTNHWVWRCPFYGWIIRYADFYPVENGIEDNIDTLEKITQKGYSILVFPEGTRSENCDILRFHKGAFYLADKLNMDIIPVVIHGIGHFFPKSEFLLRKGKATIKILDRITPDNKEFREGKEYKEMAKTFRQFYKTEYGKIAGEVETADYYKDLVLHNYLYKGRQIEFSCRKVLKEKDLSKKIAELPDEGTYTIENCGQGEFALLAALVKKRLQITATDTDANKIAIAENCFSVPENLHFQTIKE